mmetsp:Transcript_59372/g.132225  ORF Transcript_59372/g.132225 Transcript_59372/m.132225 type:complete len:254 (+) Transcript_59372:380-1141(+)
MVCQLHCSTHLSYVTSPPHCHWVLMVTPLNLPQQERLRPYRLGRHRVLMSLPFLSRPFLSLPSLSLPFLSCPSCLVPSCLSPSCLFLPLPSCHAPPVSSLLPVSLPPNLASVTTHPPPLVLQRLSRRGPGLQDQAAVAGVGRAGRLAAATAGFAAFEADNAIVAGAPLDVHVASRMPTVGSLGARDPGCAAPAAPRCASGLTREAAAPLAPRASFDLRLTSFGGVGVGAGAAAAASFASAAASAISFFARRFA